MAEQTLRVLVCDRAGCHARWEIPPEYGASAAVTPPGWYAVRQRPREPASADTQRALCSLACVAAWARGAAVAPGGDGVSPTHTLPGRPWYPSAFAAIHARSFTSATVPPACANSAMHDPHMARHHTE